MLRPDNLPRKGKRLHLYITSQAVVERTGTVRVPIHLNSEPAHAARRRETLVSAGET